VNAILKPNTSLSTATTVSEPDTDGFHLLIRALKLNSIHTLYGVVGIPITDLARLAQAEGMRYIGFRHEQSAGNAAAISGYLTQTPGVCLTVSAPGFLNGLVALANATTNCFPMIQISGSSDRAIVDLQQGDYEELDQMSAAKPFAKASFRINRPEDIGIGVARAIRAAVSGRPGGVYLDITAAALAAPLDPALATASLVTVVDPAPHCLPDLVAIHRAIELLGNAKRPLIILGKGAAYAQVDQLIRDFIERTGIPFLPMSMAKGLLPDSHPQCAASARSFVLAEADVVMLIGARLNWLLSHGKGKTWSPDVRFIQLDISATEFDSNRPIAAPVAADIASSMHALHDALPSVGFQRASEWTEMIAVRKDRNAQKMALQLAANPSVMSFYSALNAVRDVLAHHPKAYVVNEGANTLDISRNVIDMQLPRRRLDAGTWGVMGIGMGYAIGAAVVGGESVVAIEGDSAFGFSGMEMETICRYDLPIVIIVMNNGGIYRGDGENQGAGKDPSPTTLMLGAQYQKIIEAFGGAGYNAYTPQTVREALTAAIASRKPALINCVIDPSVGSESGHLTKLNPHPPAAERAHS